MPAAAAHVRPPPHMRRNWAQVGTLRRRAWLRFDAAEVPHAHDRIVIVNDPGMQRIALTHPFALCTRFLRTQHGRKLEREVGAFNRVWRGGTAATAAVRAAAAMARTAAMEDPEDGEMKEEDEDANGGGGALVGATPSPPKKDTRGGPRLTLLPPTCRSLALPSSEALLK